MATSVYVQSLASFILASAILYQLHYSLIPLWIGALLAAYLPSYLDDSQYTGNAYWDWFANLHHYRLFPATITYDHDLDSDVQYIFCSHPHGVASAHHGVLLSGASTPSFRDKFPGTQRRHLGASVVFRIPLWREYLLWLGCVDASRTTAERVLSEGKNLFIVLGGIAEQMLCLKGEQTLKIKGRKGFVRLALKYGTPIVPVYSFGETEVYNASRVLLSFRQQLAKKLSMAFLLGYGRSIFLPFLPNDGVELHQVFGKPIAVPKVDDPTPELVDKLHEEYVAEVERIFHKYKTEYGFENHPFTIT